MQMHGEETKSQKEFDSTHEWGSITEEWCHVLDRNELSKTQLPVVAGGCINTWEDNKEAWNGVNPKLEWAPNVLYLT
jgi:hypothetical protein